jgi:hypothetical protein
MYVDLFHANKCFTSLASWKSLYHVVQRYAFFMRWLAFANIYHDRVKKFAFCKFLSIYLYI